MVSQTVDMAVRVGRVALKNPVIAASGTFGYGREYTSYLDPNRLGGIVTKGVSLEPRAGNPPPRIWETTGGMLNAIGLANLGLEAFLAEKLPFLAGLQTTVIVNLYAESPAEFGELAARLDGREGVNVLEINVSCPNVKGGGMAFGVDPEAVFRVTAEVRRDLHGQADVAIAQAPFQLGVVAQRRLLQEVARAGEVAVILLAGGGLVAVEHGEGQVLDIQADAVADDEQQQHRTQQGHAAADRVATQL